MATTVAAQSIPRDANALWPGPDEDLRWRPGAFLDCHFARAIANKLSEVDPQAASDQGALTPSGLTGRPRVLRADQIELAERMRASGEPVPVIAAALGVSRATLYRTLAEQG